MPTARYPDSWASSAAAASRNISKARNAPAWATSPIPNTRYWACSSNRQRLTNPRRPLRQLDAVGCEQRQRQTVDSEGDAGGMRDQAGFVAQVPRRAEMVAVIVEAHARGRLFLRVHRNEQLEFQRLLDLAHRHQLAAATEERIAGMIDAI